MRIVRSANIDGVDILAFDQFPPVGFGRFVLPLIGKRLHLLFVTATDRLENRPVLELGKEIVDALVAVAMGSAHEPITDQSDVDCFHDVSEW